jgi:hypothetical protein
VQLKEGADPAVVTKWIAETQAKRLAAQRTLTLPSAGTATPAVTREDLHHLIDRLGDVIAVVTAEPADKAAVYSELGVTMPYDPATHTAVVECSFVNEPCGNVRVGGGTRDKTPREVGTTDLWLSAA